MPKLDEEKECYYVRGLECMNPITEEALKEILNDGGEACYRPQDYDTCSNCLKGMIVEILETILGNIPNFIPLKEIRERDKQEESQ